LKTTFGRDKYAINEEFYYKSNKYNFEVYQKCIYPLLCSLHILKKRVPNSPLYKIHISFTGFAFEIDKAEPINPDDPEQYSMSLLYSMYRTLNHRNENTSFENFKTIQTSLQQIQASIKEFEIDSQIRSILNSNSDNNNRDLIHYDSTNRISLKKVYTIGLLLFCKALNGYGQHHHEIITLFPMIDFSIYPNGSSGPDGKSLIISKTNIRSFINDIPEKVILKLREKHIDNELTASSFSQSFKQLSDETSNLYESSKKTFNEKINSLIKSIQEIVKQPQNSNDASQNDGEKKSDQTDSINDQENTCDFPLFKQFASMAFSVGYSIIKDTVKIGSSVIKLTSQILINCASEIHSCYLNFEEKNKYEEQRNFVNSLIPVLNFYELFQKHNMEDSFLGMIASKNGNNTNYTSFELIRQPHVQIFLNALGSPDILV